MIYYHIVIVASFLLFGSCSAPDAMNINAGTVTKNILYGSDSVLKTREPLPFLHLYDTLLSDRFDFPVGDVNGQGMYIDVETGNQYSGWYIAVETGVQYSLGVHTGEDWNGVGGGNTDFDQPVYSIGKGIVIAAEDFFPPWGKVVMIEHHYYENGQIDTVFSLYAHLNQITVKKNDTIDKRTCIGSIGDGGGVYPAHLHFEIRKSSMRDLPVTFWPSSEDKDIEWVLNNYSNPSEFIKEHREIKSPSDYSKLVIAIKDSYEMFYIVNDSIKKRYEICLGVVQGDKEQHRDYKTPIGEYKILNKSNGPFSGDYAAYFGTGWVKLNYPNKYDALRGVENGIITENQKDLIINAVENNLVPLQGTGLGGGIGIHGWAGSWVADGTQNMTFGCICMHNDDMSEFVDLVDIGMTMIILP